MSPVRVGMAGRGPSSAARGGRGGAGADVAAGAGRRAARAAIALLACFGASAAGAEARADGGVGRAERLFREGREAMKRGELGEACPKFAESQELDPSPGTLLNLALCEQKKGEGARAWSHFRELAEQLPASDERAAIARARAEALSQRLPRLTVRLGSGAPPGARVWLDAVELDALKLGVAFLVDPGAHAVVVQAPGRVERRYRVDAEPAQTTSLTVLPSPMPAPGALEGLAGGASPPPSPAPARPARPRRPAAPPMSFEQQSGYTLLALGGVAVAAGALSGFFALEETRDSERHCRNEICDATGRRTREAARTFTLISALTVGAGLVVGTVGGLVLWQSVPKPQASGVSPVLTRHGGGLAWHTVF